MTHRALITQDDVRKAGGIVHRDGNIFFTNIDQLNESARQYLAAPEEELCCDRCNDVLTEGNAGICANCVMPDTLAVQYAKLAQHCAMLESKLAAPEQSEPVGTKALTHKAIAYALSRGEPLTHEQCAVLLGLVFDDKVWQRECERLQAEIFLAKQRINELEAKLAAPQGEPTRKQSLHVPTGWVAPDHTEDILEMVVQTDCGSAEAAPEQEPVAAPQGERGVIEDLVRTVTALHGEVDAGWSPDARIHLSRLSTSIGMLAAAPTPAAKAEPVNQMLLGALKRLMGGTTTLQDAQEAAQQARAAIAAAEQAPQPTSLTSLLKHKDVQAALLAAQKEKAK